MSNDVEGGCCSPERRIIKGNACRWDKGESLARAERKRPLMFDSEQLS